MKSNTNSYDFGKLYTSLSISLDNLPQFKGSVTGNGGSITLFRYNHTVQAQFGGHICADITFGSVIYLATINSYYTPINSLGFHIIGSLFMNRQIVIGINNTKVEMSVWSTNKYEDHFYDIFGYIAKN